MGFPNPNPNPNPNQVATALKDAKMDKGDVDEVVLVGGSTRIPKVTPTPTPTPTPNPTPNPNPNPNPNPHPHPNPNPNPNQVQQLQTWLTEAAAELYGQPADEAAEDEVARLVRRGTPTPLWLGVGLGVGLGC